MRIIEQGQRPEDELVRARCTRCNTLIEFHRSEASVMRGDRPFDSDDRYMVCPICKHLLYEICRITMSIHFTKPDNEGGCEEKAEFCSQYGVHLHFDDSWKVREAIEKLSPNTAVILTNPRGR